MMVSILFYFCVYSAHFDIMLSFYLFQLSLEDNVYGFSKVRSVFLISEYEKLSAFSWLCPPKHIILNLVKAGLGPGPLH